MSTLKLQAGSLKKFQKKSAFIEQNNILPILGNLLLSRSGEGWFLCKNNLKAVCLGPVIVTGEGPEEMLIDEKILNSLLAITGDDQDIEVTLLDGRLTLSAAGTKVELQSDGPDSFPKFPEAGIGETETLTEEFLAAVKIAGAFMNPVESSGNFSFVHYAHGAIYGLQGALFYINKKFQRTGANISFSGNAVEFLSNLSGSVEFTQTPSHHIFKEDGYTYVFTKREATPVDITGVVDRMKLPGKSFEIDKTAVCDFCQLANSISANPVADCSITPAPGSLMLQMKDPATGRSTERLVMVTGEPGEWYFNARMMLPALKAVPYQSWKAKTNQNCLIIEDGEEYFCFLGLAKN